MAQLSSSCVTALVFAITCLVIAASKPTQKASGSEDNHLLKNDETWVVEGKQQQNDIFPEDEGFEKVNGADPMAARKKRNSYGDSLVLDSWDAQPATASRDRHPANPFSEGPQYAYNTFLSSNLRNKRHDVHEHKEDHFDGSGYKEDHDYGDHDYERNHDRSHSREENHDHTHSIEHNSNHDHSNEENHGHKHNHEKSRDHNHSHEGNHNHDHSLEKNLDHSREENHDRDRRNEKKHAEFRSREENHDGGRSHEENHSHEGNYDHGDKNVSKREIKRKLHKKHNAKNVKRNAIVKGSKASKISSRTRPKHIKSKKGKDMLIKEEQ